MMHLAMENGLFNMIMDENKISKPTSKVIDDQPWWLSSPSSYVLVFSPWNHLGQLMYYCLTKQSETMVQTLSPWGKSLSLDFSVLQILATGMLESGSRTFRSRQSFGWPTGTTLSIHVDPSL